jgi:hypothetical protein
MGQVQFPSSLFPACQAVLTGSSTVLGIVLVILWRPDRPRHIPFYSDATHNDPERVLLGCGENLACFFMPIVALVEYLHQVRMLMTTAAVRPAPPRGLRWLVRPGITTSMVIHLNFFFTLATTLFFFVTANVPSKRPFTPPHQFAASALIVTYAVQSTLKAILASTFSNYRPERGGPTAPKSVPVHASAWVRQWDRHHMKLRMALVCALWWSLLGTWLTFVARKAVLVLDLSHPSEKRAALAASMAVVVYGATAACVVLMVVMAVDMRADRIVLASSGAGAACGDGGT